MRRQRFYDENRRAVWFAELEAGEFAVLHVDRESGHHRSAEGQRIADFWTRDIPVFPDRASATEYSRERVTMFPALACRIYSADGSADSAVDEIVNNTSNEVWTPARAKRRIAWGVVLIAVGVFGVWIDWVYE